LSTLKIKHCSFLAHFFKPGNFSLPENLGEVIDTCGEMTAICTEREIEYLSGPLLRSYRIQICPI
jgi:hypothetical protein